MLNKAKYKTRLTQKVSKTHKKYKQKQEDREESDKITWSPFSSTPWRNLSFDQTFEPVVRGKS